MCGGTRAPPNVGAITIEELLEPQTISNEGGGRGAVDRVRSAESLTAGARFGRYRLEASLARGGMGEVWRATALGPAAFEKRVAIKTVLPGLDAKPGYVEMLIKEASLAARLSHPNIVQTFDLGCEEGIY
jgi:serine/threonine protein kinase